MIEIIIVCLWFDIDFLVDEWVQLLFDVMMIEEKVGFFFYIMIVIGDLEEFNLVFVMLLVWEFFEFKWMMYFNLLGGVFSGWEIVVWYNVLQWFVVFMWLGILVMFLIDFWYLFSENFGVLIFVGLFLQWLEIFGFVVIRDEEFVECFVDIVCQEYMVVGLWVVLYLQVDFVMELWWVWQIVIFGEDVEFVGCFGVVYIWGFQGEFFGFGLVLIMIKYFFGGGLQKDGEDLYFFYGCEQVYFGGEFEFYLKLFEDVFVVGIWQMMLYYGMFVGMEYEEVGFGFNKFVIIGLLCECYGFDGLVCIDWGLISDFEIFGQFFFVCVWGVEDLMF